MDNIQVLRELIPHRKYTLVYFAKNGFPNRIHFYLQETRNHIVKRKHLIMFAMKPYQAPLRHVLIDPDGQFILWNDWVEAECTIIVNTYLKDSGHGMLEMGQNWDKFDPRYLERAIASIKTKPIVYNINPVKKTEQLHDFAYLVK